MTTCSIEGCEKSVFSRTWCTTHWGRWQRMGDPVATKRSLGIPAAGWVPPLEHVLANARHVPSLLGTDCWIRDRCVNRNGYTTVRVAHVDRPTHRFVYEQLVGPIPEGLDLDHVCHGADETCDRGVACPHRRCVNPAHLEPVTHRENMLRGRSPAAVSYRANTCKYGHSMEDAYTYPYGRSCRTCRGIRNRGEKPTHKLP